MLLELSRLRGVEWVERKDDPSAFALEEESFRLIAPVEYRFEVSKDARKVRVKGTVRTVIECECGRCLDSFPVPIDTPVDIMFLPADDTPRGGDQEVADDDIGASFYRNEVIDLAEVLREQFFLALPMKPLCRPDCKGLCPICGVNRNRESCTCEAAWVDPRMEPLKRFTQ